MFFNTCFILDILLQGIELHHIFFLYPPRFKSSFETKG